MRLLIVFAILCTVPMVAAQSNYVFSNDEARLVVELPEGFAPNGFLDENLPDFSLFSFFDPTNGRMVTVSQHTYFTPEQREAWLSGEAAQQRLAHIEQLEPTDASAFPLPAGVAYRASFDGGEQLALGFILFGCDETRCYRVDVSAVERDFELNPNLAAELFAGVRFMD